jgi:hypothetical protein
MPLRLPSCRHLPTVILPQIPALLRQLSGFPLASDRAWTTPRAELISPWLVLEALESCVITIITTREYPLSPLLSQAKLGGQRRESLVSGIALTHGPQLCTLASLETVLHFLLSVAI